MLGLGILGLGLEILGLGILGLGLGRLGLVILGFGLMILGSGLKLNENRILYEVSAFFGLVFYIFFSPEYFVITATLVESRTRYWKIYVLGCKKLNCR